MALIEELDPIEMKSPDIEDPFEWVKAQRQKREDYLKAYRGEEHDQE